MKTACAPIYYILPLYGSQGLDCVIRLTSKYLYSRRHLTGTQSSSFKRQNSTLSSSWKTWRCLWALRKQYHYLDTHLDIAAWWLHTVNLPEMILSWKCENVYPAFSQLFWGFCYTILRPPIAVPDSNFVLYPKKIRLLQGRFYQMNTLKFICICVYVHARMKCMPHAWIWVPTEARRGASQGTGVAGGCEPPDVAAGSRTQVLCKSSICS